MTQQTTRWRVTVQGFEDRPVYAAHTKKAALMLAWKAICECGYRYSLPDFMRVASAEPCHV